MPYIRGGQLLPQETMVTDIINVDYTLSAFFSLLKISPL
jgi:hypothetical protein